MICTYGCDTVVAHVAAWEPFYLRDRSTVGHVSGVGSVPHTSCTASRNGRLGQDDLDDTDRDPF